MSSLRFDNATVAITGAARGIGLATAKAFAALGARTVLGDLDHAAVVRAAAEVSSKAYAFQLDVASQGSFLAFLRRAKETVGPIDVLVNNAGVMPLGPFLEQDDRLDQATLNVNFWGVVHGTKLVLPEMVARGSGHIVNVASMMGKVPVPGAAVYTASKHAVVGFSAALRDELAGTGVTVATVLPSATRTELLTGVPVGRGMPTASPEQVAAAIISTCSGRIAEFPVPRWLRLYEIIAALAPELLMRKFRHLLHHTRVLTSLDHQKRKQYEDRVRSQC